GDRISHGLVIVHYEDGLRHQIFPSSYDGTMRFRLRDPCACLSTPTATVIAESQTSPVGK
ncbi:hypothetical protein, partial [Sphingomonas mollis]|uniref:hypothetical protein n=1 Tax=Sphingomonas mollis TaxID=2795726 RepID=UPI001E309822